MVRITLAEKAKHYRETEEYLADEEESELVKNSVLEWLLKWDELLPESKSFYDYDFANYIRVQIGTWQCDNGFVTHKSPRREE